MYDLNPNQPRPRKIAIIGAGKIGQELWKELTEHGTADHIVVHNRSNFWDNEHFRAVQTAVDQGNLIRNNHKETSQFKFTTDMHEALAGADIVVVTAGVARKDATQPRSELMKLNCDVIDPIAHAAKHEAPNATYIIATNPVDSMTQRFAQEFDPTGASHGRIIGLSGELDRARMIQSICNQCISEPDYIKNAYVIGQHGEAMVPVLSSVIIKKPGEAEQLLTDLFAADSTQLKEIKKAAIEGGKRMVEKLKTSDHIAPAAALEMMINHIIDARWRKSKVQPLYASAFSKEDGVFTGRPVVGGMDGSFALQELPKLSHSEKESWKKSIDACKGALRDMPGYVEDKAIAAA